ncbi:sodium-coupled monocarboxylate transporter 2-like isoform X1 [Panulirus ornatus]|uniref:sodium-coupled monocarboxylate transporter 2-like isoform X1 n=1 Tax=Panulirus ornatus TaxID=150431 RepID=UPI003A8C25DA
MSSQDQSLVRFTAVDYTIFCLMLAVSILIGVCSAFRDRHKPSTQEFLLGGRNMSPLPVAFSLLGGVISAISILGIPTEVYFFGTQVTMVLVGVIPGTIVLSQVLLPIFYNAKIVSLNEYLELRYKSYWLRRAVTTCHLLVAAIYMGMCLYAPSLALSTVTSLSTTSSMIIMGTICTVYITIGGVKAVVYTDVMQTFVMFGGVLLVVILSCHDLGGIGNVWDIAKQGSRLEFFNWDTNIFERHTFWSTTVFGFFLGVVLIGINQSTFQRLASVSSLKVSQRLCAFFLVGLFVLWNAFILSGLVAYASYRHCDPLASGKIMKADQIVPFLVTDRLNNVTGMAGLFVAAVYSAVLSSISSTGNSMACVIWEDFMKDRPYFSGMSDRSATNVIKLLSLGTGLIAVCVALLVGKLGNIFMVINSLSSALMGPLGGIYIAAICIPFVNAKGVTVGFLVSMTYSVCVCVGKFVRGGGSPPFLPLSTEGCAGGDLPSFVNASVATFLSNATLTGDGGDLLADAQLPADVAGNTISHGAASSRTVYDVSYCYNGIIGVILTMVVGSLISLCTGPVSPLDLDERLVSPTCMRLYQWLWQSITGRPSHRIRDDAGPEEAALKMLSGQDSSQHNTSS